MIFMFAILRFMNSSSLHSFIRCRMQSGEGVEVMFVFVADCNAWLTVNVVDTCMFIRCSDTRNSVTDTALGVSFPSYIIVEFNLVSYWPVAVWSW